MKLPMQQVAKLVTLLLIVFISSSVFAQHSQKRSNLPDGPPPVPNQVQIKKMVEELNNKIALSEHQEEKILALFNNHFKKVKEKIEERKRDREEMESLKENFENKVKALLTEDQQKGYDEFLRKHHPPKRRKK
jgi:Spy/CpxP family protein refolding chaperone